jgi:hypothetical protein
MLTFGTASAQLLPLDRLYQPECENWPRHLKRIMTGGGHAGRPSRVSEEDSKVLIRDRTEAGRQLAAQLAAYADRPDVRSGSREDKVRRPSMIRKLPSGQYRLYSRKVDPRTGKRRNLGTFATRAAAEKHERAVQFFKGHR